MFRNKKDIQPDIDIILTPGDLYKFKKGDKTILEIDCDTYAKIKITFVNLENAKIH